MSRADDEGQELAELDTDPAVAAWEQYDKEWRAVMADFTERHRAARTVDERLMVELECSVEFEAWKVRHPAPPRAYRKASSPARLQLIPSRGGYRPGPNSDG